jgi:hypothetical protein
MDTSPSASGANVKPRLIENYDGQDIVLNAEKNILLSPRDFPELLEHKGERLVVTDGTTLLGADDKAGIAAIISAMAYLIAHPEVPHGKLRVGFTPDEKWARRQVFDVPPLERILPTPSMVVRRGSFSKRTLTRQARKSKSRPQRHPGTPKALEERRPGGDRFPQPAAGL